MMSSTLNSPATWPTGLVMYTMTTRMSCRKIERRNSKRFFPEKIASAYWGLIDKTAWVGLGESEDRAELFFREGLKTLWGGCNVADDAMFDQLLHVGSFRE